MARLSDLVQRRSLGFSGQAGQAYDDANQLPNMHLSSLIDSGGNFVLNDQTGNVTRLSSAQQQPQFSGSPVDVFGQGRGYMQNDGTIVGINKSGQQFKVQPEGTQAANQYAQDVDLDRRLKLAKVREQEAGGKLQFSESQGGFIEPPSAQYPQGRIIPLQGAQPKSKPLPAIALKLQQEELDAIGAASSLNKDLASFQNMIGKGKLPLGPVNNLGYKIRNMAGQSTEESRNYASFQANLERLRNESLRLNKGVQTEGDAIRAWNEIIANINDPELVMQRLGEVQKVNERGVLLRKMNVDAIRSNYGKDPMDVSARQNLESAYGNQATPNSGGGAQPSNVDALLEKYK